MPYKKVSAIYAIRNIVSGKLYIGSAITVYNRFSQHRRLLRIGKHFNQHLQASWTKHGENSFAFEVLEIVPVDRLIEREEFYISLYKSNVRTRGYNKRDRCTTNLGMKATEETRRKLRESHLGHKRSSEAQAKISQSQFKRVCKLDMAGKVVDTFPSVKEAGLVTGMYVQSISACCRRILNKAGGFYWCFEKDLENFKLPIDGRTTRKIRKKRIPALPR